jgi:hypothetical protein
VSQFRGRAGRPEWLPERHHHLAAGWPRGSAGDEQIVIVTAVAFFPPSHMRSACLGLLGIGLLADLTLRADPIQILTLSRSGDLAWVNTNLATGTYRVEFKTELTDDWQPVPGLENVVSTSSTTEVPMNLQGVDRRFFQVVWLNPPLADSFNDFRGTQGHNGWRYGYALPASAGPASPVWFNPLPTYTAGNWVVDADLFWTFLGRETMHPNGTITSGGRQAVEQWPVLRWTAATDERLRVVVSARDLNATGGNGVIARLFNGGVEVKAETIANGGEAAFEVTLDVAAGAHLDLAVDPNASDDLSDVTGYRVLIYRE